MTQKLISVRAWAAAMFGEAAPHPNTLLFWIRDGKIAPQPKKIGRQYFCSPDAEYRDPIADKINRLARGK